MGGLHGAIGLTFWTYVHICWPMRLYNMAGDFRGPTRWSRGPPGMSDGGRENPMDLTFDSLWWSTLLPGTSQGIDLEFSLSMPSAGEVTNAIQDFCFIVRRG
jgi:hypothetical protein